MRPAPELRPRSFVAPFALAAASCLSLSACVMPGDEGADGGTSATSAQDVSALFGALPTATPDKLRGVWSSTQTGVEGTADLRLRFDQGKLTAGVKCVYNVPGLQPMVTGKGTALETTDSLDGKTGQFTP